MSYISLVLFTPLNARPIAARSAAMHSVTRLHSIGKISIAPETAASKRRIVEGVDVDLL